MKYVTMTASPIKCFGLVPNSLKQQYLTVTKHILTSSSTITMFNYNLHAHRTLVEYKGIFLLIFL